MISPEAVRKQAARWWPEVLQATLTGVAYFPKSLNRIGKVKPKERLRHFDRIRAQQQALVAESKVKQALGYTLHWEERNFRDVGRNRFITGITIDTLEDYLYLLRRGAAYRRFLLDAQLIRETIPPLQDWCVQNPLEIESQHGNWSNLLLVVHYFMNEHEPGRYYIRELPLSIPTKFIETHRKILASLLEAVLPPEQVKREYRGLANFEQRYGLKYRQPMVRFRLLDNTLAQKYFSGLSELQIPLDDFTELQLPLKRVIILENKTNFSNLMNFLTLPQLSGTAGIFGSGFGLAKLKDIDWLRQVELWYWGDLDAHGLQILSQLRGYYPHTQPFLMDRITLDAFPEYIQQHAPASTVTILPHLTEAEQALFDYLNINQLRLEQERIPLAYVRERLNIL